MGGIEADTMLVLGMFWRWVQVPYPSCHRACCRFSGLYVAHHRYQCERIAGRSEYKNTQTAVKSFAHLSIGGFIGIYQFRRQCLISR